MRSGQASPCERYALEDRLVPLAVEAERGYAFAALNVPEGEVIDICRCRYCLRSALKSSAVGRQHRTPAGQKHDLADRLHHPSDDRDYNVPCVILVYARTFMRDLPSACAEMSFGTLRDHALGGCPLSTSELLAPLRRRPFRRTARSPQVRIDGFSRSTSGSTPCSLVATASWLLVRPRWRRPPRR